MDHQWCLDHRLGNDPKSLTLKRWFGSKWGFSTKPRLAACQDLAACLTANQLRSLWSRQVGIPCVYSSVMGR